MSTEKKYFVIIGYDLTDYQINKYEDWKWTDEGEQYICYQDKGNIQLFDDPLSGEHFYLGYVLAHGDQYYFETAKFRINEMLDMVNRMRVKEELQKLVDIGVVAADALDLDYRIIIFEECW